MGQALELLTGHTTAASTTFTALTMCTGNSLGIRNADIRARVALLSAWGVHQAASAIRIRSPRLHDNNQGIRFTVDASNASPFYPAHRFMQPLIPQDVLTVDQTGSGTSGDIDFASLLVYYADLPGVSGRFINSDQLAAWGVNIMGQEVSIALGTSGDYTGEVAINSGSGLDQWKANTDYALVGYTVSALCQCVRLRGVDTGNVGVGGPGFISNHELTGNWFAKLSDRFQLPLIPVLNAANKFSILVDGVQDENGTDTVANFSLVELRPAGARA